MVSDPPSPHDLVLDAARAIVREQGRPALSFRQVAKRAGVSPGTVQYYFSTLEQLVDALTDPWHDGLDTIVAETIAALPTTDDREELLLEACLRIFRLGRANRELVRTRRLDTLERGGLFGRRQDRAMQLLDGAMPMLAKSLGGDPARWRLLAWAIECVLTGFMVEARHEDSIDEATVEDFLREAIRGLGHSVIDRP